VTLNDEVQMSDDESFAREARFGVRRLDAALTLQRFN
jgi:hypothetical protein